MISTVCLLLITAGLPRSVEAQYFGRNKVQYKSFKFEVLQTSHFDIYYYPEERSAAELAARMAERWYKRYAALLKHELSIRQPIILYASQSHFEQTNALEGQIGEGTGGVTESLKRRIILPFAGPLSGTNHVLGHELVHAFQYDIAGIKRPIMGTPPSGIERLPSWFIEGMAEYLSLGPNDPNTAMWMRDAVQRKKLPKIKKLNNPRYFPYRYGEAVWAFWSGTYGDEIIKGILQSASRKGDMKNALNENIKTGLDTLSSRWQKALQDLSDKVASRTKQPEVYGKPLFQSKEEGDLYLSPALSPDGKQIVFLSTRDLFSLDMYLADVETGKIRRRLVKTAVDPHFQSLEFINSSGCWDHEGRRLAFSAISKGKSVLVILNVENGKFEREITFQKVDDIFSPTWSPDGKQIAFSALTGGLTDLFIFNLESDSLRRMTDDPFADLQPVWSNDGTKIAFATDRYTTNMQDLNIGDYRLALLDPAGGDITSLTTFEQGKNINPQWSPDSKSLYFISDWDGISNIYRLYLDSGEIRQVTNIFTGISGITDSSPSISSAQNTNMLAACVFENDAFSLYLIRSEVVLGGKSLENHFADIKPAVLPPQNRSSSLLQALLNDPDEGLPAKTQFPEKKYHSRFTLDYIGQPEFAFGADRFGSFIGGGTSLFWSDILGDHTLATMLQIDSRLKNLSGLLGYLNRKRRLNWGAVIEQTPYIYYAYNAGYGTIDNKPAYIEQTYLFNQTNRDALIFASYPLSTIRRVELSTGFSHIHFSQEIQTYATDYETGATLIDKTEKLPSPKSLNSFESSVALVFDNSFYGAASPLIGQRYRLEISPSIGSLNYENVLIDYRKYFLPIKPFTLAFRALHYGRYGKDAEDSRLYPFFLGYQSLIRGYDSNSFSSSECLGNGSSHCFDFNRLLGSKLIVANFEMHFPLLGLFGFGRGFYGYFPVELGVFYDVGIIWENDDKAWFLGGDRDPLKSYGLVMRTNLFGITILEIDYVKPVDRMDKGWMWQVGLTPGF